MRKIIVLLLFPILLWSTAANSAPIPEANVIDNFENYSGTPALAGSWTDNQGAPAQTLSGVAHGGAGSMQLNYNVGRDPFVSWVSHKLPESANWSEMATLSIWYQGLESNSSDNLTLRLLNSSDVVVYQKNLPGATSHPGWNRWNIQIARVSGRLSSVSALVVGVEASATTVPGRGTIYLDDISVTNGLETVWIGATADWNDAANWSAGVPTATTDARIPTLPAGVHMPVIQAGGAKVHDLLITANATLDQTTYNLNVTGTLENNGTTLRTRSLGSDAEKSFLTAGGHPGVVIRSGSATENSRNAEASSALGATEVGIRGGRTCTGAAGSVTRCYTVTPSNEAAADITFYFNQDDLLDQVCEDLALYSLQDNTWQKVAGPGAANIEHQCQVANFSVTVRGITEYAPYLLSDSVPTAISLESFDAMPVTTLSPLVIAAGLLALTVLVVLRRG